MSAAYSLNEQKAWAHALIKCKHVPPTASLLGCAIIMYVNFDAGTVYVGFEKLGAALGWDVSNVKKRRGVLKKQGWLIETGETKGRAKVYRPNIPDCCTNGGQSDPPKLSQPEPPRVAELDTKGGKNEPSRVADLTPRTTKGTTEVTTEGTTTSNKQGSLPRCGCPNCGKPGHTPSLCPVCKNKNPELCAPFARY